MDKEDQLEFAAAAIGRLESLHAEFMNAVAELRSPKVNGAEFGVDGGVLIAVCLGVRLQAPQRFVARGGVVVGIEYTFRTGHDGQDLPILSIYLMPNRHLYWDSNEEKGICDVSNQYLPSRLGPTLASALLASQIFAARS